MSLLPIDHLMSRAVRSSRIPGVRLAIVVDNKDGMDNPGYRVKVKFPWLSEQETSFWARIAVPMGGPGRGTYVLPEIDDQVLVVFEHGDINRPIVVGSLWSTKQAPVEVNQSGKNTTKLIKSRAGHRIIFDDREGAEKIVIVDKTQKNKIVLDSVNKLVKIESSGDIEVVAKANAILHANALKVGTSDGVSVKARSVLGHSAKTFGLKASSGITIGGGTTSINTSNAPAASVSGSGAGELGGAPPEQAPQAGAASDDGGAVGGGNAGSSSGSSTGGPGEAGSPANGASYNAPSAAVEPAPDLHELEVQVVDIDGEPVADVPYEITLPDGVVKDGRSGGDGMIRVFGIRQPGSGHIVLDPLGADPAPPRAERALGFAPILAGVAAPGDDEDLRGLDDEGEIDDISGVDVGDEDPDVDPAPPTGSNDEAEDDDGDGDDGDGDEAEGDEGEDGEGDDGEGDDDEGDDDDGV